MIEESRLREVKGDRGLRRMPFLSAVVVMAAALTAAACSESRTQIRIVGSSTVFPFTTAVAENFHRNNPEFLPPIVEATGTGGGIKLFCAGIGSRHPDVVNASRRMKVSELETCAANGAREIVELKIGIDGVVMVQGKQGAPLNLSLRDIYAGLAAQPFGKPQKARTWRDVNPALPAIRIEVIGPPSTSGTRDAFNELYMHAGCKTDPAMKAMEKAEPGKFANICTRIREDGIYAEGGENDNLIVQKLSKNPTAIGILGYSFLEANLDKIRDVAIDGVQANYDTIATGRYPASRPLFIYIKKQHVQAIRGLREFVAEYANDTAWGPNGYLRRRGLIPLPDAERAEQQRRAEEMRVVTAEDLKA